MSFPELKILNFTCEISPKRAKPECSHVKFLVLEQKEKSFMKNCFPESKRRTFTCVLRFFEEINYSSCNLSSFKEKSVRQIFWKAILEQNEVIRFSDGWSETKTRTFYFRTSSFCGICLFRFSAEKILTKWASSESRIRTRGGESGFERTTREAKQQLKELKW